MWRRLPVRRLRSRSRLGRGTGIGCPANPAVPTIPSIPRHSQSGINILVGWQRTRRLAISGYLHRRVRCCVFSIRLRIRSGVEPAPPSQGSHRADQCIAWLGDVRCATHLGLSTANAIQCLDRTPSGGSGLHHRIIVAGNASMICFRYSSVCRLTYPRSGRRLLGRRIGTEQVWAMVHGDRGSRRRVAEPRHDVCVRMSVRACGNHYTNATGWTGRVGSSRDGRPRVVVGRLWQPDMRHVRARVVARCAGGRANCGIVSCECHALVMRAVPTGHRCHPQRVGRGSSRAPRPTADGAYATIRFHLRLALSLAFFLGGRWAGQCQSASMSG